MPAATKSSHASSHASLWGMLIVEVLVFAVLGTNFLSIQNGLEVLRLSVEIGLLALAMTLVIVTGGIDLSVGSIMGLTAVALGWFWRDLHLSLPIAMSLSLVIGAACGALNGLLIARWNLPPLIVTLGTFSLYRGLAEGATGGVQNFTGYPESFLNLGQGYLLGCLPTQLPILVGLAALTYYWLHQTAFGRALMAIGYSPEGARFAGINVRKNLMRVYILSGLFSAVAAIIYVAHLGQAKADAGTGYELTAITAVVLGGTSIFGGRATVIGTLLGLIAMATLQNGLRLSDLPAELAGILNGCLLLLTIGLDRWADIPWLRKLNSRESLPPADSTALQAVETTTQTQHPLDVSGGGQIPQELDMKNSQLIALCSVILLAAFIIAGSNREVVQAIRNATIVPSTANAGGKAPDPTGASDAVKQDEQKASSPASDRNKKITIAMMPKSKGNAYFIACRKGAMEAAAELNVELLWDGPTDPDPAKQNEVIDTWITRGVDCLAIAVENRAGISSVLRKARQRGIKVVTWDSDAEEDARDFFVNQATPEGIGNTLMDQAAKSLNGEGEFAIITASLTAANMIEWQKHIEARRKEKYPNIKMAVLRPCDDKQPKAFDEANNILNAYPNVKLIMGICSPSVPGAADAVQQSGRKDVKVIGLGLPNDSKRFVHAGITDAVILWNTMELGYLTVHAAKQVVDKKLTENSTTMQGGKLGSIQIVDRNLLLGQPFVFTKENIDQFDF